MAVPNVRTILLWQFTKLIYLSKSMIILVLLSFFLTSSTPNVDTGIAPLVEWQDSTNFDFGDIVHQKPVKHQFTFKNISDQPITIDNIRTTCGCTTPDWEETPTPTDSIGTILVEFDARETGYFKKMIKVYFTGQRKAERLYIEGYVEES